VSSTEDGAVAVVQGMVWKDGAPAVKPLGFGLSTLELQAVLTVSASEKTVDAAAAMVAEEFEAQLEERGIQRVEVRFRAGLSTFYPLDLCSRAFD